MPRKIRELKAELRKAGFTWRTGKGSHTVWHHPLVPSRITLAGSDGDDAQPYQEKEVRSVLEQLRAMQGEQP